MESVGLGSVSELVERAMSLSLFNRYWVGPVGSKPRRPNVNYSDSEI